MIIIIANQETKGKLSHRTSERKAIKRTKRPLYHRPLTTSTLICPRPCETKYTFRKYFHLDCHHHYLQKEPPNTCCPELYAIQNICTFPNLMHMKNILFAKGHLHRSYLYLYLPKGVINHMATGCSQSFAQSLPVLTAWL